MTTHRSGFAASKSTPDSPRFHLGYDVTNDACPNAREFVAAVRARTQLPTLAAEGESAIAFDVKVTRDPTGLFTGNVEIREPDGARQARGVESRTCAEVAWALALIVALYLDPDASSSSAEPLPTSAPPAPAAKREQERPPRPAMSSAPLVGVGGALGVQGGIGPSLAPALAVFVDAKMPFAASWLRPSIRLSVDGAMTTSDAVESRQHYFLVASTLRMCPLELPVTQRFHLAPCAGMQVGLRRATADGVPNATAQSRSWLAPSLTISAGWDVDDRITLELQGGVAFPLTQTSFRLAPDYTLFSTPAVAAMGSVSAAVRFR